MLTEIMDVLEEADRVAQGICDTLGISICYLQMMHPGRHEEMEGLFRVLNSGTESVQAKLSEAMESVNCLQREEAGGKKAV